MLTYIANWTYSNQRQWSRNKDAIIFIQENLYGNAAYKMATIFYMVQASTAL